MNRFKETLSAKQCSIGLWSSIYNPVVTELLAGSGADWLLLDLEHSIGGVGDILHSAQIAAAYPVDVIVRVPSLHSDQIKRVLDCGVRNLLLPMINSADEARKVVAAALYPPEGFRGVSRNVRSSSYGRGPFDLQKENSNITIVAQIETEDGLAAIESIVRTKGIDGVFIGPNDLSASLQCFGDLSHHKMQDAMATILRISRQHGVPAGIYATNRDQAKQYMEQGFQFVSVGHDVTLFAQTLARAVSDVRSLL